MPSITGAKGLDYAHEARALIEARQRLDAAPDRREETVSRLVDIGVSRTHIQEYLGHAPQVRR